MENTDYIYCGAPEYFPSVDFYAALSTCSRVFLRTDLQYSRQSFQNRTKIRTPDGWTWLTIPVKSGQHGNSLADTHIDEKAPWRKKHLQALRFNYQSSPFFDYIEPDLEAFLDSCGSSIGDVAAASTSLLATLLGADFEISTSSGPVKTGNDYPAGATVMKLTEALNDAENVLQVSASVSPYRQNFEGFYPGMSALDILCNYGPEAWGMLSKHLGYNE